MKKVRVSTLAYLLSFQTTCLILFLFLMFSFSVSEHQNFLISTYDVIILAKSNNLAMLFLFNAIMVLILLGSFKPPAEEFDGLSSFSLLEYGYNDTEEKENDYCYRDKDVDVDVEEAADDENHGYDGYNEEDDDDVIGAEDEDYQEEDDDCRDSDLERRIEEFIAKVNSKRREEILRERLLWTEPT